MDNIRLHYWKHWFASLTAVFVMSVVMMSGPRYNVFAMLKLEFAKSQRQFFDVISFYNYPDALLRTYLMLDFLFIITFTALFFFSLRLIFELAEVRGTKYLLLCMIPGAFDIAEDILMWYMIENDGISDIGFSTFVTVAVIKWMTVIPFIMISLVVLLYQISIRISKIYHTFEKR